MKNILGALGQPQATVELELKQPGSEPPKPVEKARVKTKGGVEEELPLFTNKDSIVGQITVKPFGAKKFEHQGIKVQLIGQIEIASERGQPHEFVSLVRDLAPPGDMLIAQSYNFEFNNVEMQYESYFGSQARCRYMLRVTLSRPYNQSVRKEFPFWVRNYENTYEPEDPSSHIKMEVGIEECLHIEFEYNRSRYHLDDCVVGKIYFLLVRIKLKHMELEIRRKETTGAGATAHNESDTLAKYEIMDGAPVRGEAIPIRLYLTPFELTPSYLSVHNKFSVKYYLNLVLVDEEDRRYFKQQEVTLCRLAPGVLQGDCCAAPSLPHHLPPTSPSSGAAGTSSQHATSAALSPSPTQPQPAAYGATPDLSEASPSPAAAAYANAGAPAASTSATPPPAVAAATPGAATEYESNMFADESVPSPPGPSAAGAADSAAAAPPPASHDAAAAVAAVAGVNAVPAPAPAPGPGMAAVYDVGGAAAAVPVQEMEEVSLDPVPPKPEDVGVPQFDDEDDP